MNEYYSSEVVPDNVTRTDVDLGELGGLYYATCEIRGNSLITYFRATDEQKEVIEMTYSLKDVASGEKLVQILYKHETF